MCIRDRGSVAHTVVGALIIIFIRNGMNILGVATTWQQAVVGGVILLSIVLEKVTQKMVAGSKRKAAAAA